jgi:hypothetical protein
MRKPAILTLLLGFFLVPALHAQSVYSDTYVIPVVSHTTGANGTTWMSDVVITNFAAADLNVQAIVVEAGETSFDNVFPLLTNAAPAGVLRVPANSTVLFRDILNGHRGQTNSSGALILGGDQPFAVTSRSYSMLANGALTSGQTVTPARDFFENSTGRSDNSQVAILPGITSNAAMRTNIGFLAGTGSAAGSSMAVQVTIKDASGRTLGTKLVTIPSGAFVQTQFAVSSITTTPFDIGSAELRIVQGLGTVVPYASMVDNATGNATYVMGQFPASAPLARTGFSSSIFRTLFGNLQ